MHANAQGGQKAFDFLQQELQVVMGPLMWMLGPHSNPLEGQHVLLTAEPPLQPPPFLLFSFWNMVDLRITPSQTEGAAELRAQSNAGFDLCTHSGSQSVGLWAPLLCLWASISAYGQDRGKEEVLLPRDFLIHCTQCPGP